MASKRFFQILLKSKSENVKLISELHKEFIVLTVQEIQIHIIL